MGIAGPRQFFGLRLNVEARLVRRLLNCARSALSFRQIGGYRFARDGVELSVHNVLRAERSSVSMYDHSQVVGWCAGGSEIFFDPEEALVSPAFGHLLAADCARFCAVDCDITLVCSPMQFPASPCESVQGSLASQNGRSLLGLFALPPPSHPASRHPT